MPLLFFQLKVLHSGSIEIGLELYRDIAASCYLELNCHTLIIQSVCALWLRSYNPLQLCS